MRSNKVVYLALSLILLEIFAPFKVQAFKIDLDVINQCSEVALKAVSTLAVRVIPCTRKLAKCAQFTPMKTKDLDISNLALLVYQFMQKIVNSQKCLLISLKEAYEAVSPHVTPLVAMKCNPFS
ncbi:uncharacterized protein LOC108112719 [Drosophila eugracilis]|uniref:uncharacterized protein LOC108112719 n=1 Tax=Drosophila eugracilis TaxID=29029 RepID=UPI0007E8B611|nr:uncharacterized protein LOC108112719 [Drosophila eugracilis]